MLDYLIKNLLDGLKLSLNVTETSKKRLHEKISDYVSRLYDKYRLTKNPLFRNQPVDFYENYLPISLKVNSRIEKIDNPISLLEDYRKAIVLGPAGCGKTTLLRYITLKCIDQGYGIPVYIELRNFQDVKFNFESFVSNSIIEQYSEAIHGLFEQGNFVFILDGYDEIDFVSGQNVIYQIEKFITKYGNNQFIISSRLGTNIESFLDFFVLEIHPLSSEDIEIYLEQLQLSSEVKEQVRHAIYEENFIRKYLQTPLFLLLYISFIRNHHRGNIPLKLSVFFRSILDSLFSQHDSVSKLGFVRNRISGLPKDDLESVSNVLAFRALITSNHTFSKDLLNNELEKIKNNTKYRFENEKLIYDLTISVNIMIAEGNYYTFPHVTLMEYMAALYISRLRGITKAKFYDKVASSSNILISTSFLTFLSELDYVSFVRNFLIPKLESFRKQSISSGTMRIYEEFLSIHFQDRINYLELNDFRVLEMIIEELKMSIDFNGGNEMGELFEF